MSISFKQFLAELFDSCYDFKWVSQSSSQYKATFQTDKGYKYLVTFSRKIGQQEWEVVFALTSAFDSEHFGKTKTGNEFKVFSTVVKVVTEFLRKHRPETLYFFSRKDDDRDDFYKKLTYEFQRHARKEGYFVKYDTSKKNLKFLITIKK